MYFNLPVRLFIGENCVRDNKAELLQLGKRCLIVTDKQAARLSGALDDVTKALDDGGIVWSIYDEIEQNPLLSTCYNGGRQAAFHKAEFIIGIGGGSPLDAAKAIAVFAATPDMQPEDIFKAKAHAALPIVLVGTTAGTASEITRLSILTLDKTGEKCACGGQYSYATLAFGDYQYTTTLPWQFTVTTALDSFSHAMEGYFSQKADLLSDIMAIETLKLLVPVLEQLTQSDSVSKEQRELLYRASIYAGFPLNRCGTVFGHRMGYYLTETRYMPHGNACAVFQGALLTHAEKHAPDKCYNLYQSIGRSKAQLLELLRTLASVDFEPLTDQEIDRLLQKWETTENIQFVVGGMTRQEQQEISTNVMQKKQI